MSVHPDMVSVTLMAMNTRVEARVPARLLDNKWHTIEFLYELGNLNLVIDKQPTIIGKLLLIFFLLS